MIDHGRDGGGGDHCWDHLADWLPPGHGRAVEFSGGNLIVMLVLVAIFSLILGMGLPTTANYIVVSSLMAACGRGDRGAERMIVPLIAAPIRSTLDQRRM